jgi:hypothetical protein
MMHPNLVMAAASKDVGEQTAKNWLLAGLPMHFVPQVILRKMQPADE